MALIYDGGRPSASLPRGRLSADIQRTEQSAPIATSPIRRVTGRNLAHAHRTATARAFLAADIKRGVVIIEGPTDTQLAAICRVSVPYVRAACRVADNPDRRADALQGRTRLYKRTGNKVERIAADLKRATPAEQRAIGQLLGADWAWDHLVAPLVV
jgi:hypothetical protein